MPTHTELCATVERFGGWSILVAKDHQPTRCTDLADPPWGGQWTQAQTWDTAHGRLEHWHIRWNPELTEWFANPWAGVAHVFRLPRTTTLLKTGEVRQQTV